VRAQVGEHALLLLAVTLGELRRRLVADRARGRDEPVVGGDLEGLGRALVLGVLEQLLLAALAAQDVDGPLESASTWPISVCTTPVLVATIDEPAPSSPRRRSIAWVCWRVSLRWRSSTVR
jgi:hypothetical protein